MPSARTIPALLLFGALMAGCGGDNPVLSSEPDEPGFREAQRLEKQGRTQEALAAYLKVIAKRGDQAPDSCLDAGLIYLNSIKDPIAAIYYFRKYMELQPNSRQAAYVPGLIDTAKRQFAAALPAHPLENPGSGQDTLEELNRLQRENDELKSELAALRTGGQTTIWGAASRPMYTPPPAATEASPITAAPLPSEEVSPAPAQEPARAAPAASVRTHTIVRGDTLFNLAQRYYGNRSKWRDILAANRDQLAGENTPLRIGMVLKIP